MLRRLRVALLCLGALGAALPAFAQDVREGSPILPAHRSMYERGLAYLMAHQGKDGGFSSDAGVTGICVMALLASGRTRTSAATPTRCTAAWAS